MLDDLPADMDQKSRTPPILYSRKIGKARS